MLKTSGLIFSSKKRSICIQLRHLRLCNITPSTAFILDYFHHLQSPFAVKTSCKRIRTTKRRVFIMYGVSLNDFLSFYWLPPSVLTLKSNAAGKTFNENKLFNTTFVEQTLSIETVTISLSHKFKSNVTPA